MHYSTLTDALSLCADKIHSFCFRPQHKHIDWKRIGAFYLDSPFVVLALIQALPDMPPMPGSDVQTSVNETGMCSLTNVRTGIWIAGRHLFGCPVHKPKTCTAMGQVLDARHVELFLEEDYRNGTWQYEDIFEKIIPGRANIAAMPAIIDPKIFLSPTKAWLLRVNSRDVKEHTIYTNRSSHGVAVCTYLPRNNGIVQNFKVMRDNSGGVVSIRISHQTF
ncbi:hypothetical protein LUZ61_004990 [Rhynchospora tenuis]|uniref:Uncharacterized protein n=1 Tax=Rhynchospora tenuis TaxID=198213 RepID=A0AAD5ZNS1_9POAL|nr:hypothetical protein LUZ61_004990 [Rhynchospora tenuis]